MAPEYLRHLFPPTITRTTIYPLRNGDHLIVPFCKASITNSLFIYSTVKEWNTLSNAEKKSTLLFSKAIHSNIIWFVVSMSLLSHNWQTPFVLTRMRCRTCIGKQLVLVRNVSFDISVFNLTKMIFLCPSTYTKCLICF